jgi:peptidoglycan/LPS O-acetylase OafA/YrhL
LNRQFSIYLDAIRIIAALIVFLQHLSGFIGGWLWQFVGLGHEAVVLFFVLSGFVISYVTNGKENTAIEYTASRFARIYSVALPALILTIIFYYAGDFIDHESLSHINERQTDPILTIVTALFFIHQSWWDITIFSNMPYWSLGYEVLYYVFFGVLCFSSGLQRMVLLAAIMAIMGPSVLLYLPVWLMGVVCQRMTSNVNISVFAACSLFFGSLIFAIGLCFSGIQAHINEFIYRYVGMSFVSVLNDSSKQFGSDYLLAIAMASNIFSYYFISMRAVLFNEFMVKTIRFSASYTFSLYLYHMPVLFLMAALFPYSKSPVLNIIACSLTTILMIVALGNVTEKKKSSFKKLFFALFRSISNKPLAGSSAHR